MPTTLDLSGLGRIQARLRAIGKPSDTALSRLGIAWSKIIVGDNTRGVMAGLDKDGRPMEPVKYRPRPTLTILKPTAAQRNTASRRARTGQFAGHGPAAAGLNNNLTPREYGRLAGPPLAPRGRFSRVITNLRTQFGRLSATAFQAIGYWDQVVSTKGVPFLLAHFEGRGRLPKRDLRGVRPEGVAKARTALRAWAIDFIRRGGA